MDALTLHTHFQAEEEALQRAFNVHGLIQDTGMYIPPNATPFLRDVITLGDDDLCAALTDHIAAGVDVNAAMGDFRIGALRYCFGYGKTASLRLLLRAGAKSDWTKDQERLALGETPVDPDTGQDDPFWFACRVGNLSAAQAYLTKYPSGQAKDPSAVMAAAQARAPDCVAWLMEQGFDPNAVDRNNWCALERAVDNDDTATADVLLAAGADPFGVPTKNYTSPVRDATTDHMRRVFIKHGIHPSKFEYALELDELLLSGLPETTLSQSDFDRARSKRPGQSNPDPCLPPFWSEQMRTGRALAQHGVSFQFDRTQPIWSFNRFGRSMTALPDGRLVLVAGEHEDFYDDDFCIYADVTVLNLDGSVDHYLYPEEIFPPTDFHSATRVKDHIWLIGALSYPERRCAGETQVLRLDLADFSITPVRTTGNGPGWIHGHIAILTESGIQVFGGKIEPGYVDNEQAYLLNLDSLTWSPLT